MRPLLAAFLVLLWAACAGAAPPDSAKKGSPAELTPGIRGGGGTQRLECPKKADLSGLPRKAPTRAEYLKLVEGVVAEYGKKASRSRGPIDAVLRGATADGDGADLGALFLGLGAGPSAVYATAWSAKRNPDDPLTANNLGVTLKDMGDYRRALAVLLYADRLRPDAPLVLVNRAWVHYELGDFEGAKPLFEKVVRQAPESPSAHTGLGLIAHCRGDKTTEFLFRDIARLVFADEGRLGKATHKLNQWVEESSRRAAGRGPEAEQAVFDRERERVGQEIARLEEAAKRCHPPTSDHWTPNAEESACMDRFA